MADFPLRCALVPERGPNIRRLIHGNYLIFYRYDKTRDQVVILRIVHGYRGLRKIAIE
ncbi:MAG: type II toxin-antitoxin system RelE/ParE family toxin [Pseudomonadota bacterium]